MRGDYEMGTKNDRAWQRIFESSLNPLERIEKDGYFYITADQIKEYGKREPRLITKIDHSQDAPQIFKDNKLSILPTKRGEYIVGPFKTHEKLAYDEKNLKINWMKFPSYIQSIDPLNITSESVALNAAHVSGMIEDFVGEPVFLTVDGRMSSQSFEFYIENNNQLEQKISVERSQVEIDGGYEGKKQLVLIEAKNKIPEDFLVRQLYYPYALWKNKMVNKKVVPIFFTYVDNIFSFFQYDFKKEQVYNSLELVKVKHYAFDLDNQITREEIQSYVKEYQNLLNEPENIPFPQADNFLRVLDAIKNLKNMTKEISDESGLEYDLPEYPKSSELAQFYGMANRQGAYYGDALVYLGIAERVKGRYQFTKLGEKVSKEGTNERIRLLIQSLLQRPVFRKAFVHYIDYGDVDREYLIMLIRKYVPTIQSDVTRGRRAQTVKAWIEWLKEYYK